MPTDHTYWVYLLAGGKHGTLYAGVTNSLERRIAEHKAKEVPGFTKAHTVDRLVWFRGFGEVTQAIHFEKQLKRWRRDWKVRLIEEDNPNWQDLYPAMMALPPLHPDLAGIEINAHSHPQGVIPVSPQAKTGTYRLRIPSQTRRRRPAAPPPRCL